ncbi:TNF receptor-associated factor 5 [Geodia barretti]|uniref:TNF receptor-associated factor 5 n=1 Tax=Geodia barretti TaxID=519541 RepID=A0AA35WVX4_GEOBA|nr:TNF receptor-associated factor 5 [Geodia barretti]
MKTSCAYNRCLQIFFIIVQILFIFVGCVLIGLGAWFEILDQNFEAIVDGDQLVYGAYLTIAAGCAIIVLSVIGIFGAICDYKANRVLLFVYIVLVIVVFILQSIGGILAFTYREDKICRECVEQIKKDGEPCPLCNRTEFSFMRDYGLERSLKEFVDVRCAKTDELKRTTEDLKKENLELKLETDITLSLIKAEVKQLRASKFGFPIEFRVQDNQGNVFLPPFYTHSCGYKLSAEVSLSGTHVSIYTYMMEGDYDDHLKWPFEGVITVQIVNQTGDHSHIEKTILYDDKAPLLNVGGRVLGTHRSGGWGLVEFMPRSSLFYNTQRNTEYWKGGFIVLRVTKVTLL